MLDSEAVTIWSNFLQKNNYLSQRCPFFFEWMCAQTKFSHLTVLSIYKKYSNTKFIPNKPLFGTDFGLVELLALNANTFTNCWLQDSPGKFYLFTRRPKLLSELDSLTFGFEILVGNWFRNTLQHIISLFIPKYQTKS